MPLVHFGYHLLVLGSILVVPGFNPGLYVKEIRAEIRPKAIQPEL